MKKTSGAGRPDVSVVVATYNEAENLPELIPRIHKALSGAGINEEIIVVDDNSPDGTAQVAKRIAKKYPVRVIEREKKQGLIQADICGFMHAKADIMGCIDADFSHPPEKLPELIKPLLEKRADISVGSKYVRGSDKSSWPMKRKIISFSGMVIARPLSPVKDSVAGFFFFQKNVISNIRFRKKGFKTLLEILVKGKYSKAIEIPITFIDREAGESKMGTMQVVDYLVHLGELYVRKILG